MANIICTHLCTLRSVRAHRTRSLAELERCEQARLCHVETSCQQINLRRPKRQHVIGGAVTCVPMYLIASGRQVSSSILANVTQTVAGKFPGNVAFIYLRGSNRVSRVPGRDCEWKLT